MTPSPAAVVHTADATNACPTCGGPVAQPKTGRRRIYCSADCRREMYTLNAELSGLEAQLAEAENLTRTAHNDHWRQHHERRAAGFRGAVTEARMRIPEALR
jgi:endogenous inhibitor of DNA gyrase (YacG/DUF329 family)